MIYSKNIVGFSVIDNLNEEKREKIRHDKLYKSFEDKDLFIAPKHYCKFDEIKKHLYSYTYSVSCLGDVKGKRILDVGCGTGTFSIILAKRGAIVCGIDISRLAIEIAQKRAMINNVFTDKITFKEMSFYETNFSDASFDLIIGMSALHHANDKNKISKELWRVLKKKGKAVFNEPFGNSLGLEKIRQLLPIKGVQGQKDHWKDQIKYKELKSFEKHFVVNCKEYQMFSRLDRLLPFNSIKKKLANFDYEILNNFRFLRPYARDIVIVLEKKI
jgi:2-polyprenyl-3-methyl-5-hydroxy-6-metoxy-1,4-benzoquinol methylase